MRRCCASLATTLSMGGYPYDRRRSNRRHLHKHHPTGATNYWRPLLRVTALVGGASARRQSSYGCRACSRPPTCGMLPLRAVAPCRLAVGDCPYLL
ncbi:hypothetical protein BHE74_00007787 [Ensete ventricosum]|nr:hypothetical protein GW17_00024320 [Ensete ventricosum]RWW83697.1 hypothetical protein BHE74_00007787 [Ensete ventricosum]